MADENFKRYEKKYLLDGEKYFFFYDELSQHMQPDKYGLSTICNIYFDTDNFRLVRESMERPVYKEKLRIRTYGIPGPDSEAFVEIKKKFDGVVYKRRLSMKYDDAFKWLTGKSFCEMPAKKSQVGNEVNYFLSFYGNLRPSVVLCYDRVAFFDPENPELRVTIDTNIRSRKENLDLRVGDYGDLLFEKPKHLIEIKVPSKMPFWMTKMLGKYEIYPTSFSKYGRIYEKYLTEEAM